MLRLPKISGSSIVQAIFVPNAKRVLLLLHPDKIY